MRSAGDNKVGAENNKPENQGLTNAVLPSEIPADRPPVENIKKMEDNKIRELKNPAAEIEKKIINKQSRQEPKKQLSDLEKLEMALKNKKSIAPAVTSKNKKNHINVFNEKKTRYFDYEGKEKLEMDVSAIEQKKRGLNQANKGEHTDLFPGDIFSAGNEPVKNSKGRYGEENESNLKPAIGGGPGPGGVLFDSVKRGNGSDKSASGKTPGILQNPDLDARDILKKGDHYKIPFEVILDSTGAPKIIKIIKTSGFIKLDNKAINHIKNNWRWAPGFEDITVPVELTVVIPK